MLTTFPTRKTRKSRMALERLEDRQLLASAAVLTFGQTLAQIAPHVGFDHVGAIVPGSYSYLANTTSGLVDVTNTLLHVTPGPESLTQVFTPTDSSDAGSSDTLTLTVDKANWQITANSIDTTYNGQANPLGGTFAFNNGNGQFVQFQTAPGVPAAVNATLPVTYTVSGLTGNQTALRNAISNATITPSIDPLATEADGTLLSSDINFSYVTGTANIARAQVTGSFTAGNKVYDGTTSATVTSTTLNGIGAPEYLFTYNDGVTVATAELTVTNLGDGTYLATGGSLDVTSGPAQGIYPLLPGGPGTFLSPTGMFNADNVVQINSGQVIDSTGGLLFGSGSTEINIWSGDGNWGVPVGNYGFWVSSGSSYSLESTGPAGSATLVGDDVQLVGTAVFSDANVGTGKTVTMDAALTGADASNYFLTNPVETTTANITPAQANVVVSNYSVTYDDNAHSATGVAYGINGTILPSSDLVITSTHTNAGTYTDSWSFSDPNYASQSGTMTDSIAKANAVISVTGYGVTYDGTSHTATGTATGVQGEALAGLDLSGTMHTNAGTYSDPWVFTDVTGNYNNASGTVADSIAKANAVITVTPYSVTYNGLSHTATGSATGVLGESLNGLDLSATTHVNAGNYIDPWSFTDTTGNYNNATGSMTNVISQAPLIVAATSQYQVYYIGWVNGENASSLGLPAPTFVTNGNTITPVVQAGFLVNYNVVTESATISSFTPPPSLGAVDAVLGGSQSVSLTGWIGDLANPETLVFNPVTGKWSKKPSTLGQ